MKKKLIAISLVILAILSGVYGVSEWFREHGSTQSQKTDIKITATEIFDQFTKNEVLANDAFLEKTIEISGKVRQISNENNITTLFLETNDPMFGVACIFDGEDAINVAPEIGSTVTIKGICSGITFDVVLNRCVIIN